MKFLIRTNLFFSSCGKRDAPEDFHSLQGGSPQIIWMARTREWPSGGIPDLLGVISFALLVSLSRGEQHA
jgi:hypothetical protein